MVRIARPRRPEGVAGQPRVAIRRMMRVQGGLIGQRKFRRGLFGTAEGAVLVEPPDPR
jgi:hypothetical protein